MTTNQVAQRMWINQPFLDALGMRMPTTTEEFYQYLVGVKTRDPNRNGRADEIPLVSSIDTWMSAIDGFLMMPFIYNDVSNYASADAGGRRRIYLTEAGVVETSYNKPEWRQGLEYMRRLYAEGLMAPESFTLDRNGQRALVENVPDAIVGALPNGGFHEFANTTGERRTHYRVLPPLKGPNGVQQAWYDQHNHTGVGGLVITKDSLIPEVVIKWTDYWYTEDIGTRNRYGVLGRDWLIPPAGTVAVSGGQAKYEEILRWGTPQNAYIARAPGGWSRFFSYDRAVSDDPYELEKVLWDGHLLYWPYRFMRSVPNLLPFTVEEARENTRLLQGLADYVDQSLANFVTGRTPLNDANWNAYVQQIERLEVNRYKQIVQTAFDRSWAAALGYRR